MQQDRVINLSEWYTSDEATERLALNVGRPARGHYARALASAGKIEYLDLGARARLYLKKDVDGYRMGNRGPKPK